MLIGDSQGYWPDGLYTPPTYEAMVYDLQVLKNVSMNMVRKHIKVEPDLWYRACDEMGLLVIQDMPSLQTEVRDDKPNRKRTSPCPNLTIVPPNLLGWVSLDWPSMTCADLYARTSRMGTTASPSGRTTSIVPFHLHLGNLQ